MLFNKHILLLPILVLVINSFSSYKMRSIGESIVSMILIPLIDVLVLMAPHPILDLIKTDHLSTSKIRSLAVC